MPDNLKNPADYIQPLFINGLAGRMLHMPAQKNKKAEILFIYGHHSSLERWFGVADYLTKFGTVTVPDLPGFGGMEPFYKIGEKPTLDNMADYLASFIKLRYKGKRFSLAGLSLGFLIVTRMLQKYPDIAARVDILVSFAGFTNKEDFGFSRRRYWSYRLGTKVFSWRLTAAFFKHFVLRPIFIKKAYKYTFNAKEKFEKQDPESLKQILSMEVNLWRNNDPRTYMHIAHLMFTADLTGQHVGVPVYHLAVDQDKYFNNVVVEQHMRQIFNDFILVKNSVKTHSPSVIATAKEAEKFIPPSLRRLLSKRK